MEYSSIGNNPSEQMSYKTVTVNSNGVTKNILVPCTRQQRMHVSSVTDTARIIGEDTARSGSILRDELRAATGLVERSDPITMNYNGVQTINISPIADSSDWTSNVEYPTAAASDPPPRENLVIPQSAAPQPPGDSHSPDSIQVTLHRIPGTNKFQPLGVSSLNMDSTAGKNVPLHIPKNVDVNQHPKPTTPVNTLPSSQPPSVMPSIIPIAVQQYGIADQKQHKSDVSQNVSALQTSAQQTLKNLALMQSRQQQEEGYHSILHHVSGKMVNLHVPKSLGVSATHKSFVTLSDGKKLPIIYNKATKSYVTLPQKATNKSSMSSAGYPVPAVRQSVEQTVTVDSVINKEQQSANHTISSGETALNQHRNVPVVSQPSTSVTLPVTLPTHPTIISPNNVRSQSSHLQAILQLPNGISVPVDIGLRPDLMAFNQQSIHSIQSPVGSEQPVQQTLNNYVISPIVSQAPSHIARNESKSDRRNASPDSTTSTSISYNNTTNGIASILHEKHKTTPPGRDVSSYTSLRDSIHGLRRAPATQSVVSSDAASPVQNRKWVPISTGISTKPSSFIDATAVGKTSSFTDVTSVGKTNDKSWYVVPNKTGVVLTRTSGDKTHLSSIDSTTKDNPPCSNVNSVPKYIITNKGLRAMQDGSTITAHGNPTMSDTNLRNIAEKIVETEKSSSSGTTTNTVVTDTDTTDIMDKLQQARYPWKIAKTLNKTNHGHSTVVNQTSEQHQSITRHQVLVNPSVFKELKNSFSEKEVESEWKTVHDVSRLLNKMLTTNDQTKAGKVRNPLIEGNTSECKTSEDNTNEDNTKDDNTQDKNTHEDNGLALVIDSVFSLADNKNNEQCTTTSKTCSAAPRLVDGTPIEECMVEVETVEEGVTTNDLLAGNPVMGLSAADDDSRDAETNNVIVEDCSREDNTISLPEITQNDTYTDTSIRTDHMPIGGVSNFIIKKENMSEYIEDIKKACSFVEEPYLRVTVEKLDIGSLNKTYNVHTLARYLRYRRHKRIVDRLKRARGTPYTMSGHNQVNAWEQYQDLKTKRKPNILTNKRRGKKKKVPTATLR